MLKGETTAAEAARHHGLKVAEVEEWRDRFLLGSPDEVAEAILRLHHATGINHLIMSVQWPGMPQSLVLDELHMLAEEVFPRVRRG